MVSPLWCDDSDPPPIPELFEGPQLADIGASPAPRANQPRPNADVLDVSLAQEPLARLGGDVWLVI